MYGKPTSKRTLPASTSWAVRAKLSLQHTAWQTCMRSAQLTSWAGFGATLSSRRAKEGHGTGEWAGSSPTSGSFGTSGASAAGGASSLSATTPFSRSNSTSSWSLASIPEAREATRSREAWLNRLARSTWRASSSTGSGCRCWSIGTTVPPGTSRCGTMPAMGLAEIAATSAAVAATSSRLAKTELLAACLVPLRPAEVPIAVAYLSGELPGRALGVGWAAMRSLPAPVPGPPTVTLLETEAALGRIRTAAGPGSQGLRRSELSGLFGRLTEPEQRFLRGLMSGELRQGALGGVMVEAVARAAGVPRADPRRAVLVSGDLAAVAAAAVADGRPGLARFRLTPGRPLRPMLAQTATGPADAMARIGQAGIAAAANGPGGEPRGGPRGGPAAGVEWKFDGVRVQVHRSPSGVSVFTRNLADVTDRVPEVVDAIEALPVASIVLAGELSGLRPDGRPRTFPETMGRLGSRVDVAEAREAIPLSPFLFDSLPMNGEALIDHRAAERFAALAGVLPPAL